MPIYDYKCPSCKKVKKDILVTDRKEVIKCAQCHENMKRLFPNRFSNHTFPNGGIFLEHVSPTGKTFHSKQEMKDYAKKNNLELGALL